MQGEKGLAGFSNIYFFNLHNIILKFPMALLNIQSGHIIGYSIMQQAEPALHSPPFKVAVVYSTIHPWKLFHLRDQCGLVA